MSIPLLEGGLLSRGAFSRLDEDTACDVLLFTDVSMINSVHLEKKSLTEYEARVGQIDDPALLQVVVHPSLENPQQFSGTVTQVPTRFKFIYTDIHEPITISIGVITIVVVVVSGLLCALSDVIGLYANRRCKKIRIDNSFGWKEGNVGMHCSVECLDPTVGSETPLQKSATISSPSENDSIKHKKAFVRKIVEEELRKKGIGPDKYLVGDVLM